MWHYLFFIVLVKVKDSTEYTGPESYVAEMIRVRLAVVSSSSFKVQVLHGTRNNTGPQIEGVLSMQPSSLRLQSTLLILFFTSSVSDYLQMIM